MIARYDLHSQFPEPVLCVVDAEPAVSDPGDSTSLRKHFVVLDNQSALKAAAEGARRRGFVAEIADDISDQPIEAGCSALLQRLDQLRAGQCGIAPNDEDDNLCLISGGGIRVPRSWRRHWRTESGNGPAPGYVSRLVQL